MLLLHHYLPTFTVHEVHTIQVARSPDTVYPVLRHLDFNASWITRWLFKIRRIPAEDLSLDSMIGNDKFYPLEESQGRELLMGLLCNDRMIPVAIESPDSFRHFDSPGHHKIAWNFSLEETGPRTCRVTTETRVLCLDGKSRRKFLAYWFVIRPFSGLIRREMLRIIKKESEKR